MRFAASPVSQSMTTALITTEPAAPIDEVAATLARRHVSAVPVLDDRGSIVGVVSRSDLLHHQRLHPHTHGARCADAMTQGPIVVAPDTSLREAAQLMLEHHFHRLFVVDRGQLAGVITTTDLTRAVEAARLEAPIRAFMSAPVVTIRVDQPLSLAIDRLDRVHISGLVVTDNDWPIGVFTQEEALAARDTDLATPVGDLADPALICLPYETSLHRAAAQCARMGVRRIVACHDRDFVGVVTGLDFAAAVAQA